MNSTTYSTHLAAEVRRYFSLQQAELARYLSVSAMQIAHVEAGRRGLSAPAEARLLTLAQLLPPPHGEGTPWPATPAPVMPAVPAGPVVLSAAVQARLRRCRHLAAQVRFQLENWEARAAGHARRRQALALLAAALPMLPAPGVGSGPEPVAAAQWLAALHAATPAPPAPARRQLLQARLAALELEATLLATGY